MGEMGERETLRWEEEGKTCCITMPTSCSICWNTVSFMRALSWSVISASSILSLSKYARNQKPEKEKRRKD